MQRFQANIGLVAAFLVFFVAVPARAQQTNALTPLLVDLAGWAADPAEGVNMNMPGMKMINAVREYNRGGQQATAMVMVGSSGMTQGQIQQMNLETDQARVRVVTINGFKVHISVDKADKSGGITVFLSQRQNDSALFTLYFEGIPEKEGLAMAKKFNWQQMKGAADKLM
jgi:hypothetical protein